jgi:hypothetical protein
VRFLTICAVLISALLTATSAFAQTDTRTPPKIADTTDADIKAEYLEAIPWPADGPWASGTSVLPLVPCAEIMNANNLK